MIALIPLCCCSSSHKALSRLLFLQTQGNPQNPYFHPSIHPGFPDFVVPVSRGKQAQALVQCGTLGECDLARTAEILQIINPQRADLGQPRCPGRGAARTPHRVQSSSPTFTQPLLGGSCFRFAQLGEQRRVRDWQHKDLLSPAAGE